MKKRVMIALASIILLTLSLVFVNQIPQGQDSFRYLGYASFFGRREQKGQPCRPLYAASPNRFGVLPELER